MQELIRHEQFEIEVLDRLNSSRLLGALAFGGGTMLRLCWGLDRYSVDLDFWVVKETDPQKLFQGIHECLSKHYSLRDSADKFHTLLLEIRSSRYPRGLKIEVRKEQRTIKTTQTIAFSPHAAIQVMLKTIDLSEMVTAKITALIDRKEIRDAFDLEFLLKKGFPPKGPAPALEACLKTIAGFTLKDYTVKLGSILDPAQRKYYTQANFKLLVAALNDALKNPAG